MPDDFSKLSNEELVSNGHLAVGGGSRKYDGGPDPRYEVEMMRRLMVSINRLNRSATAFSIIMGVLTLVILIFTISMWNKM